MPCYGNTTESEMNVYKVSYWDAEKGRILSWYPDLEAAERELSRLYSTNGNILVKVERVVLSSNKHQLLAWLNANLHTDNG